MCCSNRFVEMVTQIVSVRPITTEYAPDKSSATFIAVGETEMLLIKTKHFFKYTLTYDRLLPNKA